MAQEPTPKDAAEAEEAIKRKAVELDRAAAKRAAKRKREIHPERKKKDES